MSLSDDRLIGTNNNVILTCTVTLSQTIDSDVNVAILWYGPDSDVMLINSSRLEILDINSSNGTYISRVTISSYTPSLDNGEYFCNGSVIPLTPYITGNSAVNSRTVRLSGRFVYVQSDL